MNPAVPESRVAETALSSAVLAIDLDAIAANYRLLQARAAPATIGAVVKADGYGLGAAPVARRLAGEGCRSFFVAHAGEGAALRAGGDPALGASTIYVLDGFSGAPPELFCRHRLTPVLPTEGDVALWRAEAEKAGRALPAILHFDTGLNRLGLAPQALDSAARTAQAHFDLKAVMSHLACAEDRNEPMNEAQRRRFEAVRARFPGVPASLANSSAIFLGSPYLFDLVRPGAALYGLNPTPGAANPMRPAAMLQAPILQVRTLASGDTVGYGATFRAAGPMRAATIGVGYADGYLRALGGRGAAFLAGKKVPVLGRVSMDLLTLDVTGLPEAAAYPGALVELIGPHIAADELAAAAGTIGYEILTGLGRRYRRLYKDAGEGGATP